MKNNMDIRWWRTTKAYKELKRRALVIQSCCYICGSDENLGVTHKIKPNGFEAFFNIENVKIICRQCYDKGKNE